MGDNLFAFAPPSWTPSYILMTYCLESFHQGEALPSSWTVPCLLPPFLSIPKTCLHSADIWSASHLPQTPSHLLRHDKFFPSSVLCRALCTVPLAPTLIKIMLCLSTPIVQWFSKCGPQTSIIIIIITQELIRNVDSWATSQTYWTRLSGGGSQHLSLNTAAR